LKRIPLFEAKSGVWAERRAGMNRPDLQAVAKRVVWFKTPEDNLREVKLFLSHVMSYLRGPSPRAAGDQLRVTAVRRAL
jgi:hypothetical protein